MGSYRDTASRNASRRRNYEQTAQAGLTDQPWLDHEVEAIMHRDKPDRELAAELFRSVQAIQVKRSRVRRARAVSP